MKCHFLFLLRIEHVYVTMHNYIYYYRSFSSYRKENHLKVENKLRPELTTNRTIQKQKLQIALDKFNLLTYLLYLIATSLQ